MMGMPKSWPLPAMLFFCKSQLGKTKLIAQSLLPKGYVELLRQEQQPCQASHFAFLPVSEQQHKETGLYTVVLDS